MEMKLSTKIYPLEAMLSACFVFIDRAYVFLDADSTGKEIKVFLKPKKNNFSKRILEVMQGEFMNELLHYSLRHIVSKNNKKIKEFIIGRALYSVLPVSGFSPAGKNGELDYQEDPLGIAVSWEEKYGKNKKKNSSTCKV